MTTSGFNASGTAMETCPKCGGTGAHVGTRCTRCQGFGRVPVPQRGITDPDEHDLERAGLERKLETARKALAAISNILRDGATGRGEYWTARRLLREWGVYEEDLCGDSVLAEVARVALEKLS